MRAKVSSDYQRDWPAYFESVSGLGARETCVAGIGAVLGSGVPGEGKAEGPRHGSGRTARGELVCVDIACGEGRDTRAVLASDPRWRVIAIDASADGLSRLSAELSEEEKRRVETVHMRMEEIASSPRLRGVRADLVNASFALPFCEPGAFAGLWGWVRGAIAGAGDGVFAGQLFGDEDEWKAVRPDSHYTRAGVETLMQGLRMIRLEEVRKEGEDAMGGTKRYHVFHVVASAAGRGAEGVRTADKGGAR